MRRYWNSFVRKVAPVLGAGFLLQASGCAVDMSEIAQGLLTATVGNLIASYVYGAFNVSTGGFF